MSPAVPGKLAIIGAGSMGNAIAALFATHGWEVMLIEPSDEARERSRQRLLGNPPVRGGLQARFAWSASLEDANAASLIIEAAPEDLELKKDIFSRLEPCCPADAIIATNTSGLSINRLAESLKRPERFLGTHFFTPADIIPLVEVIACKDTSAAITDATLDILRGLGKLPVRVQKDVPGFIGNRLQHALAREAMSLLENGVASAEDIDTVARWSLGVRLALTGPLEQRDINGLDIHHTIASYLYPALENRETPPGVLSQKVAQGHLGVKTGRGFYDWQPPQRRDALKEKEAALRRLVALVTSTGTPDR